MPDRREIERLKNIVRGLADEVAVLKERGEPYVDLPLPPEPKPLSPEAIARVSGRETGFRPPPPSMPSLAPAAALPGGAAAPEEPAAPEAVGFGAPPPAEEEAADFSSLLQGLDLSEPSEAPAEMAPPAEEEAPSFGLPEDFGLPLPEETGEAASSEAEAAGEAPSPDLSSLGELGDLSGFGEAPEGGGGFGLPEAEGFDLGAFAEGAEETAPEGIAPEEAPSAEAPAEGFALPGEESLFAEPTVAEEGVQEAEAAAESFGPEAAEPGWGDFSLPEEGGAQGEAPAEEFGIPSSEEFGLPSGSGEQAPAPQAPAPGGEAAPPSEEDVFSSFNFGEGVSGGTGNEAFDMDLAALEEPLKAPETFSLGGEWQEPGAGPAPAPSGFPSFEMGAPPPRERPQAEAGEEKRIALDERSLDLLQDALLSYPLNLRVAIEKAIANSELSEAQAATLVDAMVRGQSAAEVAPLLGKMTGQRIRVPKGFERRTGEALEAEQGTFWYAFKKNILPLVGIAAAAVVGVFFLVMAGYYLAYVPLHADWLYRSGYAAIGRDDYVQSELVFDRADLEKRSQDWHFRYARAYRQRKAWAYAEKKYLQILKRWPKNRKAALEYADMQTTDRQEFESAQKIIKDYLLYWYPKDRDGLMALGNNDIAWSDEEDDAQKKAQLLDEARKTFASLIRLYGRDDPFLGGMARYFIRTDKLQEVLPIRDAFLARIKPKVDALTLSEIGGYLIDKGELAGVPQLLNLGVKYQKLLPENHYQLARYYRKAGLVDSETAALDSAINIFRSLPGLSRTRIGMFLDSLNWRGQVALERGEVIPAKIYFQEGIALYEDSLAKMRFGPSARFGELYADMGRIAYSEELDDASAFSFLEEAEANGYVSQETLYQRGYIRYRQAQWADALLFFYRARDSYPERDNLSLAMADAFAGRGDWGSAAGAYRVLAGKMAGQLESASVLDIQARPREMRYLVLEMMCRNNLGVSLYHLSLRQGSATLRSEAMAEFSEAARLYDRISRDPESMKRLTEFDAQNFNLAFSNMDGIFHPEMGFDPKMYSAISRNLEDTPTEGSAADTMKYGGF